MVAIFIIVGVVNNVTVKAAQAVGPIINYVGVEHSPLAVGDTEKFTITSKYEGKVQYRAFLFDGRKWSELTSGYGVVVDAKTPYALPENPAFKLGNYKLSVWVKRAGTASYNSKGYDTYYVASLNCVSRDDASRVYVSGAPKVSTKGLTVNFNGIENIGGIEGPYLYRLHIFNPRTGVWTSGAKEYTQTPSYTFKEEGAYMMVVHANTVNSTTWGNYLAVTSVSAMNTTQVLVTFNKEVDKTDAETAAKYKVSAQVPTAILQADKKSVLLTTKTPISGTNIYTVNPVKAAANVAEKSITFTRTETYVDIVAW